LKSISSILKSNLDPFGEGNLDVEQSELTSVSESEFEYESDSVSGFEFKEKPELVSKIEQDEYDFNSDF